MRSTPSRLPVGPEVIERGRRATRGDGGLLPRASARIAAASPGSDLLSGLVEAEEAGDRLSERELLATCILLYVAGHETTVNLIGNGLLALLRHPDERRRLQDDPGLLPAAIEELLRYDGPVQRTGRIAACDAKIAGVPIPEGTLVLGLLGAANRDPSYFAEPDRLDLGAGRSRATWRSVRGSTTVSAPRSLGWKLRLRSGPSCDDFRHWPLTRSARPGGRRARSGGSRPCPCGSGLSQPVGTLASEPGKVATGRGRSPLVTPAGSATDDGACRP